MSSTELLSLVALALLLFWTVGAYQRLLAHRKEIANAFSQLEAHLRRRHDILPPLAEATHPWPAAERDVLERLHAACKQVLAAVELVRAQPGQAGPVKSLLLAEAIAHRTLEAAHTLAADANAGAEAVGQAPAADSRSEATPPPADMASGSPWPPLSQALAHNEAQVAFARQVFNEATLSYNAARTAWPTRWVARWFRFRAQPVLLPLPAQKPQ